MASTIHESRLSNIFKYTVCALMFCVILVPLYIAVFGGFKVLGQLYTSPLGIPDPFVVKNYTDILTEVRGSFWLNLMNSIIIAAGSVFIVLFFGSTSAFALARLRFRLNSAIFSYFLLGLLFPIAVAILPLYLQLRGLGLLDRYWGAILPQAAFQLPWQVLLLRGFFRGIPRDLEDACAIDGYGPIGFLFHMVIPLSTPILATSGILTLVKSWNDFFLPLLVFNDAARFPLPLGVMDFQGVYISSWNLILGYVTLAMIPAVIIFIFAQKYIVAGLTGGAIKG